MLSLTLDRNTVAAEGSATCVHCGTPCAANGGRPVFCCAGCQFVHGLIVGRGFDKYYDLQAGETAPVKSFVFQPRDYSWLSELVALTEAEGKRTLVLDLQGISCAGCVWLIEHLFRDFPGSLSAHANAALGDLTLRWEPGKCDLAAFARDLQRFGYLLGPPVKSPKPHQSQMLARKLGICGAFAMNAMLFSIPRYLGMEPSGTIPQLFDRIAFLFATLSMIAGGSYFFTRTWKSIQHRVLHIDIPISLGLIFAYAGSVYAWHARAMNFAYFDFVSTFTFLMLLGRWTQQAALDKNRNRLLKLHLDAPEVRRTESGERCSSKELKAGDRYQITPGQALPVRSKLLSKGATLGMEWISGESDALEARTGQLLPSGALLTSNDPVELEAMEGWDQSLLARLIAVTPREEHAANPLAAFIRTYILTVLVVAAIGFTTWYVATGTFLPALQVLISILVVSCPCAAGVALPVADELATARLRRLGVFVKEQGIWGRLRAIRKIIFDKTGTLTLETMELTNPGAIEALDPEARSILLRMVANNAHPVSGSLREYLMANAVAEHPEGDVEEETGIGLSMAVNGALWRLGRPQTTEGTWDCEFTRDDAVLARFSFAEQVRPDARIESERLRKAGMDLFILSGDRDYKVQAMAESLGLTRDHWLGQTPPQQKADWVRQLDNHDTLMIGDGANDSLAFNEAWCTGTPAVDRGLLEQKADFYFLGRGLSGVRALLETARLRRLTSIRVVTFAISYNVLAVALCLAGKMSPLAAAILMPLSSLVSLAIVLFSLRVPRRGA